MTPLQKSLLYWKMAPLYSSLAVQRVVVQDTKFANQNLLEILEKVNSVLERHPTHDENGLIEVALTAGEYHINYIRFSLNSSTRTKSLTTDAIKLAQSNTLELQERLSSAGPLSEDSEARARRTETCFRDVLSTLEEWRKPQGGGARRKRPRTGAQSNDRVEPMLRSSNIFESEAERTFFLRLRHLHLRAATLSSIATLQELFDLCQELRPDLMILSEVMTDTALRSIILLLFKSKNQIFQRYESNENLPTNVCNFLKSCFTAMNQPAHLQLKEESSVGYKIYVNKRKSRILGELRDIDNFIVQILQKRLKTSLPVKEASPSVPPSAVWRRLQSVESVAALTEGREEEACAICREDAFCQDDFGTLSDCCHLFCVLCIADWFKSASTCPMCRAFTSSWTTKKHFEDLKQLSEIDEDTVQPVAKRTRRNTSL